MLQFIIFLFLVRFCKAFGPPGHIPPNDFMAENWYPKNLPTVQPPWKHDMDNRQDHSKEIALPTPPSPPGPTVVMGVTRSPLTTLTTTAATSIIPSTFNTSFTTLATTTSLSTTTSISNSISLSTITHQLTSTSASTSAVTPNTTQSTSLSTEIPANLSSTTPTANSIITSEIDFTTMLPLSNSTNTTLAALITIESTNSSSSSIALTTNLSTSTRPQTMKSTTDMITTQKTQNLSSSIATTTTSRSAIIPIPIKLSPFFEDITVNLEPKKAEKDDINQIDKADENGENELDKSSAPIILSKSTSTTKLTTEATTSTKLILSKTTSTPDKHHENSSPNSVNENEIVDITKQSEISIDFKPIINNGFILKSDGRALVDNSQTFKLECPDLLFIVDSSGNALNQFEKQKDLVKSIMLALGVENRRYGLMTYAGKKRQRMNAVTTSFTKFLSKLKDTKFISGITATGAALERAATILHVRKHSTQVIVVTDGFSFDEVDIPAEILRNVPGVEVYVTGDYQPVVNTVLESIAGIDDNVFLGPNSIRDIARTVRCN